MWNLHLYTTVLQDLHWFLFYTNIVFVSIFFLSCFHPNYLVNQNYFNIPGRTTRETVTISEGVAYLVARTRPSLDQLCESAVYKFNTYIHVKFLQPPISKENSVLKNIHQFPIFFNVVYNRIKSSVRAYGQILPRLTNNLFNIISNIFLF